MARLHKWLFLTGNPENIALATLDYAYFAQPFVYVKAFDGGNLQRMDVAYFGQPFVSYVRL